MSEIAHNPFAVQTPEDLHAQEVVDLFVPDFSDFHKIPLVGHAFLNGSRGSGKSMIFRFLEPDCQSIKKNKPVKDLPFYSVYVPIKNTELKLTELARLEKKHASFVLNEHFMTTYIGSKIFASLLKAPLCDDNPEDAKALFHLYENKFTKLMKQAGWPEDLPTLVARDGLKKCLTTMMEVMNDAYVQVISYLRRLSFSDEILPYSGALFGYHDFLVPLMKQLKNLPFMPKGPLFLLVDDADNLSKTQTMILNSWVSYRTSTDISLKISTQLTYKTYMTMSMQRIDSPHDYSEVNISEIYTSQKEQYRDRVQKIIEKRFKKYGIDSTTQDFFPPDIKQEGKIKEIENKLKEDWKKKNTGKGNRPGDDALRYARPIYMTSLEGIKKSGSTYKYAGFDQLVHLSSGVVRYFLEPASLMYGEERARNLEKPVKFISPTMQDKICRQQANSFLFSEFDKIVKDEIISGTPIDNPKKLKNLINALGGMFHEILKSDQSERKVFSIAFSDLPDEKIIDVLNLGVKYGYFQRSSIGNKEGTGRTEMYILSRRLAPAFKLDPTGFAGYKFITSSSIAEAIHTPKKFVNKIKNKGVNNVIESPQLLLFDS